MANGPKVGETTAGEAAAISRSQANDIMSRSGKSGSPIEFSELPLSYRLNLSNADIARLKAVGALSGGPEVGETTETEAAKMAASGLFELPSVKMGETYAWKRAQLMDQGTPPTDDQLTSLANLRTIWLRQLDRESAQAGGLGVSQELSASEAVAKDPVDSALMTSMSGKPTSESKWPAPSACQYKEYKTME